LADAASSVTVLAESMLSCGSRGWPACGAWPPSRPNSNGFNGLNGTAALAICAPTFCVASRWSETSGILDAAASSSFEVDGPENVETTVPMLSSAAAAPLGGAEFLILRDAMGRS